MKKTTKKLVVSRETVQVLGEKGLGQVVGGSGGYQQGSTQTPGTQRSQCSCSGNDTKSCY
jgi:hypothetical protein